MRMRKKALGLILLAGAGAYLLLRRSGGSLAGAFGGGRLAFIAECRKHKGKPYVLGANGPDSFDCASLVQYAYRQQGIEVADCVTEQAQGAPRRIDVAAVGGWQTAKTMLKAGDCVGFDWEPGGRFDHVVVWTGNSWLHASSSQGGVVENPPDYIKTGHREIYSYLA